MSKAVAPSLGSRSRSRASSSSLLSCESFSRSAVTTMGCSSEAEDTSSAAPARSQAAVASPRMQKVERSANTKVNDNHSHMMDASDLEQKDANGSGRQN